MFTLRTPLSFRSLWSVISPLPPSPCDFTYRRKCCCSQSTHPSQHLHNACPPPPPRPSPPPYLPSWLSPRRTVNPDPSKKIYIHLNPHSYTWKLRRSVIGEMECYRLDWERGWDGKGGMEDTNSMGSGRKEGGGGISQVPIGEKYEGVVRRDERCCWMGLGTVEELKVRTQGILGRQGAGKGVGLPGGSFWG